MSSPIVYGHLDEEISAFIDEIVHWCDVCVAKFSVDVKKSSFASKYYYKQAQPVHKNRSSLTTNT